MNRGEMGLMSERSLRADIQALRALAVGLVVIFHIWPNALPAGFVGVDVFFVISGFLITGLLLRDAEAGRLSVCDFYVRRVRRLLPAALLVLVATAIATLVLFPPGRWRDIGQELGASALYVENWYLAWQSTDYFGSDASVSPVQHFWSLAIEEQFYIVWGPLVAFFAFMAGTQTRSVVVGALLVAFVTSYWASVTFGTHAEAYFLTYTRAWELALGGILAASGWTLSRQRPVLRWVATLIGLSGIVATAFLLPAGYPFPGWVAIVPTVGAALIIAADLRNAPVWSRLPLVRQIGDRSYSLYLWHWPLVVFTAAVVEVDIVVGLAVLGAALVISDLSFRYVERRFMGRDRANSRRPLAATAVVAVAAAAGLLWINTSASLSLAAAVTSDPRFPGPNALRPGTVVSTAVDPIPALVDLRRDAPHPPTRQCHQDQKSAEPLSCTLGDPDGRKSIAIVGDSHAAQWVPALETIANERGYRLLTFTKSACPIAHFPVLLKGREPYDNCLEWSANVEAELLKIKPDIVLTSQSRHYGVDPIGMATSLVGLWRRLEAAGVRVAAIADTPKLDFAPHECLGTGQECRTRRGAAEAVEDPIKLAAQRISGVTSVFLNDWICGVAFCDAVIGNVVAWRDDNHLTATYSRMLAPFLAEAADL